MKYSLTINERKHTFVWTEGSVFSCRLDGEPFEAEGVEIVRGVYSILIGGKSFHVHVEPSAARSGDADVSAECQYKVQVDGTTLTVAVHDPRRWQRGGSGTKSDGPQHITAPMPGKIVRILVSEQQLVEAGQGAIVVEAMKMQNEIRAGTGGVVAKVLVREGQLVAAGETLVIIE